MIRRFFLALCLTAATLPAHAVELVIAPSDAQQEAYIEALKTPGHALIMRHTLAPGHNDPSDFSVRECQTQRNLNDYGREQAVRIGGWLRERGVDPQFVYTSPWCRCIETAELMALAPVVQERGLRSFAENRSPKGETLARLRKLLASKANEQRPVIMVTHSSTIADLIGGLVGSGEGVVVKLSPDGQIQLLGRVLFGQERV